jgi:hypothetical protein
MLQFIHPHVHLIAYFFHLIALFLHFILNLIVLFLNLINLFLHHIAQLIDLINNGIIDFFLEFVCLMIFPLDYLLHFLDDTIPLIFHISSIFTAFRNRFAQYYEVRKPFLILIVSYRHH